MSTPRHQVRPARAGDEAAICALFETGFGRPLAARTWAWKYATSPWADPTLSLVAVDAEDSAVAHIGVAALPLDVIGAQRRVGVVADFVVAPGLRDLSLAYTMFDAAHARMHEARVPAGLSFPNETSVAPLHMRAARVAIMEKYRLPLGAAAHHALRSRVDAKPADERIELGFSPNYVLDERYDRLWASCRALESLSVWKDRRYLQWKYLEHPELTYRMMTLTVGDALAGLCVCAQRRRSLVILEVIALEKTVDVGRELLLRVADQAQLEGLDELRFIGHDPWFLREVLVDFERRPYFSNHVFARATQREEAFLYENPLNWTVTGGDCDSV